MTHLAIAFGFVGWLLLAGVLYAVVRCGDIRVRRRDLAPVPDDIRPEDFGC